MISDNNRAPVSLKDGVGSRAPGLWLHFLGLLLSSFRTVLAPSPRRLDTKFRFHQLLKCNRHEGDRSWLLPVVRYLFRPRAEKLRLLEERKGANVNKRK
ncbi:homeodomain interacting protein kinase [Sarotherodon galilaeus]